MRKVTQTKKSLVFVTTGIVQSRCSRNFPWRSLSDGAGYPQWWAEALLKCGVSEDPTALSDQERPSDNRNSVSSDTSMALTELNPRREIRPIPDEEDPPGEELRGGEPSIRDQVSPI